MTETAIFLWRIEAWELKMMEEATGIRSKSFTLNEKKWYLMLNCKEKEGKKSLSLYLYPCKSVMEKFGFELHYTLLYSSNGSGVDKEHEIIHTFTGTQGWGSATIIPHGAIHSSVPIVVGIHVKPDLSASRVHPIVHILRQYDIVRVEAEDLGKHRFHANHWKRNALSLCQTSFNAPTSDRSQGLLFHGFDSPTFSDVTFRFKEASQSYNSTMETDKKVSSNESLNGQIIHAHRNILCWSSAYFRGMFTSGMKESHAKEIFINDIEYDVFYAILCHLYGGTLYVPVSGEAPLFKALHLYGFGKDVLDFALDAYKASLTPENVLERIESDHVYDDLKNAIGAFVKENQDVLFKNDTFKDGFMHRINNPNMAYIILKMNNIDL